MKRTFILGTLLLIAGCTGSGNEDKNTTKKDLLPKVSVSYAQVKQYTHKINVQGNVETDQDILVNAEMSGLVKEVHVSSGKYITKGQLILTMDEGLIEASISELKSQLEFANYMLSKQEELMANGLGVEMEKKTAENQVNSLNSKLETLKIQKSKMTVRAPFSGTVETVYAKSGQVISPQVPVLRLVNNSKVDITASVSEKHFKNIKIGSDLRVSFPNYGIESLNTKVKTIGNFIEPTNRTFTIRTEIKNNKVLMPNMLAEIEITDLKIDSGLVISSKSILKNPANQDFVWVLHKKDKESYSVHQVLIKTLSSYEGEALIETNDQITDGTMIIEGGARGITSKDIVRIN